MNFWADRVTWGCLACLSYIVGPLCHPPPLRWQGLTWETGMYHCHPGSKNRLPLPQSQPSFTSTERSLTLSPSAGIPIYVPILEWAHLKKGGQLKPSQTALLCHPQSCKQKLVLGHLLFSRVTKSHACSDLSILGFSLASEPYYPRVGRNTGEATAQSLSIYRLLSLFSVYVYIFLCEREGDPHVKNPKYNSINNLQGQSKVYL